MSELLLCCGGTGIHAASCPSWRDIGHAPIGQDPLPPALGEIQRTHGDVLVWDGSGWASWDGVSRRVSQVLAAHQLSRGMQVATGTTCSCGAHLKRAAISQHQAQILAEAGLLKEDH